MRIRPIYSQVDTATPPSVRAPLDTNSGFAAGLQDLSGALDVVTHVANEQQKYIDSRHTVSATTDLLVELQDLGDNLSRMSYDELVEVRAKKLDDIKAKYDARVGQHGRRVQQAWTPIWENAAQQFLLNTNDVKNEKFRQESIASGLQYAQIMQKQYVDAHFAEDDALKMSSKMAVDNAFDLLRQDFNIPASQAENWKSTWLSQADSEIESTIRDREQEEARLNKLAEEEKKQELEDNYSDALILWSENKLTTTIIKNHLKERTIDPTKGKAMLLQLKQDAKEGPVEKDNAFLLGDLAKKIGMGVDVSAELESALRKRQVKSTTYISMMSQIGNEQQQKGSNILTRALAPGPADQWNFDRNVKFGEAISAYNIAIANGKDAQKAALEIVDRNTADLRRSFNGLAYPKYLEGNRQDDAVIREAQRKTTEAFTRGLINEDEYSHEINLLFEHLKLINQLSQANDTLDSETKERIKAAKNR